MEVFNILFESAEIVKKKAKEIERMNIEALRKSNEEIRVLLSNLPTSKKRKVIYVHDNTHHLHMDNFPVDHRIVKR